MVDGIEETMEDRFLVRFWTGEGYLTPGDFCNMAGFWAEIIKPQWDKSILEQCTGLKDKNGKLIFEGDVIEWEGYEVQQGKQVRPLRRFAVRGTIESLWKTENIVEHGLNQAVIIGNVNESPEFLEGK